MVLWDVTPYTSHGAELVACFCWFFGSASSSTLKIKAIYSFETSVFLRTTRCYNLELNTILNSAQLAASFFRVLAWLTLDPDDGSDMFLRNVGHSPNYMVLQLRSSYSSETRLSLPLPSAGSLLILLFDHEQGGDMYLRNVGLSPNYTALQPTRPYSTVSAVRTSYPTGTTDLSIYLLRV
jgi:hypothetical protein